MEGPVLFKLQGTVGRNSLLVSDDGFVVYNTPKEMKYMFNAGVELVLDHVKIGYTFSRKKGDHYSTREGFTSNSHIICFRANW